MDHWLLRSLVSAGIATFGASGFWVAVMQRDRTKSATSRLMMGMAYDYIMSRGMEYIGRGFVTKDELEELTKYFFDPYKALGGNGVAERVMREVKELPIRYQNPYVDILNRRHQEGFVNNVRVVTHSPRQEASSE